MQKKFNPLIAATCFTLLAATSTHAITYSAIEITVPNASQVQVQGLNDNGQVVGDYVVSSKTATTTHGFITGANGVGMSSIAPFAGDDSSSAEGVNNAGQVVGFSFSRSGAYAPHPFMTGPNGSGVKALSTIGTEEIPHQINASGQIVGEVITSNGYRAFITGANGNGVTSLGSLGGGSGAYGINDSGVVAGISFLNASNNTEHAFIYGVNGGGMTDLGTFGGASSSAYGINNLGQVAGSAQLSNGYFHAFITGANGAGLIDIGTIGGTDSYGNRINASGQVVGYGTTADGDAHAFVTGANGTGITDLNQLLSASLTDGGYLEDAYGINSSGQIIAVDNLFHSYLLTPVPLPGAAWLMISSLGGLGLLSRRRS